MAAMLDYMCAGPVQASEAIEYPADTMTILQIFYSLKMFSLKFYAIVHCGIKDTSAVRVCPGCFRSLSICQVQAHCPD